MEQFHDGAGGRTTNPEPPATPTKHDRATFLKAKLKSSAKRVFASTDSLLLSSSDEDEDPYIFEDAAFDPQRVPEAENPHDRNSIRDRLHRGAHAVALTVKNPKRALRAKYARNVAGNLGGQPGAYDRKYDEELVDAHDALERANANLQTESSSELEPDGDQIVKGNVEDHVPTGTNKDTTSSEPSVAKAKARIRKAEAQRDSLRIAWILGRHVKRVRIPEPAGQPPTKPQTVNDKPDERQQNPYWGERLAQRALWHTREFTSYHIDDFDELPFDFKELTLTTERLAVVSAPWQSFLIEVRSVYLWEDPARTFKYLVLYSVLWYHQHIVTAALAWVVFATIKNRLVPTEIETLRRRVQRSKDSQAKAQAWGELIQRHGKHDWVEPLLDDMGPLLQLQFGDLSDLLERFQNFYRWEQPRRTAVTLCILSSCLLLICLADIQICVRLGWLGLGYFFFVTLPLSAKFPKYRALVNPISWILWGIPNQAQLAITELQGKAILRDMAQLEKKAKTQSTNEEPDLSAMSDGELDEPREDVSKQEGHADDLRTMRRNDQITFRAVHSETQAHGRLRILRDGFWYYDKRMKSFYHYSRLSEIRKVDIDRASDPDSSTTAKIARRIEESSSLQFLPSGIEFIIQPPMAPLGEVDEASLDGKELVAHKKHLLALTVSESDRNKIFSLIIAWSGLKWQPQFSLNRRNRLSPGAAHPAKHGKGNKNLDQAIKGFIVD